MKLFLTCICGLFILFGYAQQTDIADFKKADVSIYVNPDKKEIRGTVIYEYDTFKAGNVFLNKRNISIDYLSINGTETIIGPDSIDGDSLKIEVTPSVANKLEIKYHVSPKKAFYFLKRKENWNIWTQGQGKYTSHWLPSFDDVNEKIEFDLDILTDENYEVIANGKLSKKECSSGYCRWFFDMKNPMSSYLVALVIGNYDVKLETSNSGVPLEFYYYPADSLKVEPTYRYSKRMFDFLEEEIGVPFPWQNYKQVPVHDFLYAGMENTSLTIFSDAFMVDDIGFNDKNYVNVNAHELAHQWFGNLVTAESGEHHWLQEGFATYYALLAERDIFGEDYFHFSLFETAVELGQQDLSGNGTSLLDPKSSSLTFYQRGAWVLHALRAVVGDTAFRLAIKRYLEKHKFDSVETSDFIKEIEQQSGKNLEGFKQKWIVNKNFPVEDAISMLQKQSSYVQEYIMIDCQVKSGKCTEYLKYYASDDSKVKIISQAPELVTEDTFKNGLKVRQAIAQYVKTIPKALKKPYETLLEDPSYITIESALYNLWVNFPEDRPRYLAKTRGIYGFNDYNVRLLWIVLNLNTPFYTADNKQGLYSELVGYTNDGNSADLRMNAFRYLSMIGTCDDQCQLNLESAKSHHNWRMVKFAKDMSNKLQEGK